MGKRIGLSGTVRERWRVMETSKHGDREKTGESGERRAWTTINHAVREAARGAEEQLPLPC